MRVSDWGACPAARAADAMAAVDAPTRVLHAKAEASDDLIEIQGRGWRFEAWGKEAAKLGLETGEVVEIQVKSLEPLRRVHGRRG